MNQSRKEVTLTTDGACSGNPGPGGWAAVLVWGDKRKELSGAYRRTTNNRMELMGVIAGLETLREPCRVKLVTDSRYVANAIERGWAERWRRNGWKRNARGEKAINSDLWARLLDLCARHELSIEWVAGHSGHPENERCDQLAVAASQDPAAPPDPGYA